MGQFRFRDRVPLYPNVKSSWLKNELADLQAEQRKSRRRRLLRNLASRTPMLIAVILSMGALVAIDALISDTNSDHKLVFGAVPDSAR
ncbi:MAG TPA: hypothetical protein VNH83_09245 [Bryobacteraceae bacterium]|nr:hypothetical protein [Bryobacteraceae bacterium]